MKTKNPGISLVLYSRPNDGESQSIARQASRFFPPAQISVCSNCREVADALRGVLSGYGILLLMIRERDELEGMARLGDRLRDHSVILILDDALQDLTRQAFALYPRYTGGFKADHTDILMVMEKMITKIEDKLKGEDNG